MKERETKASQAVQERKAAAAEMRKQMKEERAKLTALRKTKNRYLFYSPFHNTFLPHSLLFARRQTSSETTVASCFLRLETLS